MTTTAYIVRATHPFLPGMVASIHWSAADADREAMACVEQIRTDAVVPGLGVARAFEEQAETPAGDWKGLLRRVQLSRLAFDAGYSATEMAEIVGEMDDPAAHVATESKCDVWVEVLPLRPSVKAERGVTLYREIDALGGTGTGRWHDGYSDAIGVVLDILQRRGFSEVADATPSLDNLATAKARLSIAAVRARNSGQEKVSVIADDVAVLLASHSDLDRTVSAPAGEGVEEAEALGWLVEWTVAGQDWVETFACEVNAIDKARMKNGTCIPLYRAAPTEPASPPAA